MPKRRNDDIIDVNDLIESVNLDIDGLLQLNHDELTAVLAHIANEAQIPTSILRKARIGLPSFSATIWSNFAQQSGLPRNVSRVRLEPFNTPKYRLPPSLHESMFQNSWLWQDVYREKIQVYQINEEASVRILDPYIVPIVALFQGRLIDMPEEEEEMPKSKYSTGGEFEHEIAMDGGTLLFIKIGRPDANALAQLFLQFLTAAEMNKELDFAGLRIYGVLTDHVLFKFYSYDPTTNQFCFDETLVNDNKRISSLSDMMDVSNKIFGVILEAYINGLHAMFSLGNSSQTGDTPSSQKSPLDLQSGESSSATALMLAEGCRSKLKEQVTSLQDIEENAINALALLTESTLSMPRASPFTGEEDDPSNPAELKLLAARITKETHEMYLFKNNSQIFV